MTEIFDTASTVIKIKKKRPEESQLQWQRRVCDETEDQQKETANLRWYRDQIGAVLDGVLPIFGVLQIVYEYMTRICIQNYGRSIWSTGRYILSLHHKDVPWDDVQKQSEWHLQLATILLQFSSESCLFYDSNSKQTIVLLNLSGSCSTNRQIRISPQGHLRPVSTHIRLLMRRLIYLPDHVYQITGTELEDMFFARQWVEYVGCHGYKQYPQYRYSHRDRKVIQERENTDFPNHFISAAWKERTVERFCTLRFDCDCDILDEITPLHHFCRGCGNRDCEIQIECRCYCESCTCEPIHTRPCKQPELRLCYAPIKQSDSDEKKG